MFSKRNDRSHVLLLVELTRMRVATVIYSCIGYYLPHAVRQPCDDCIRAIGRQVPRGRFGFEIM